MTCQHKRGRPITPLLLCAVAVLLLPTACKKSKDDAPAEKCPSVAPTGRLVQTGASFTYTTKGGGTIVIDPVNGITIRHKDYTNFRLEYWGGKKVEGTSVLTAEHENLNGKHIKDRNSSTRAIVFPDGAKVTFMSDGYNSPLQWVSIYDGTEYHHIRMTCHTAEVSAANAADVAQKDAAEADGETATFEITPTGLLYVNLYTEETAGNKVQKREVLGELVKAEPQVVNDFYDDPRRGDT